MCEFKICIKCNIDKPLENFYTRKSAKDGHYSICKTCMKLESKTRYKYFTENPNNNITEQCCNKCKIIKPIINFYKHSGMKFGYDGTCKDCIKASMKEYDITYDVDDTKRCPHCNEIKNVSEFYIRKHNKDGLDRICKTCVYEYTKITKLKHPDISRRVKAKRRNFGYNSINKTFNWSDSHHLHLENNNDFVISVPCWLHRLYSHNSHTWKNMDTINAIALDYWLNEELYKTLYEI